MLEKFRFKLGKLSADSLAKYRRSLSALEIFMIGHGLSESDLSPRLVEDLVFDMMQRGKSASAIVSTLNVISSVLKGETETMATAARTRELARQFRTSAVATPPLVTERIFTDCLSKLQAWLKGLRPTGVAEDILTVSLLGGGIPVNQLIELRKADVSSYSGKTKQILERNLSTTRDYVFDLRQSYQTLRQIRKKLVDDLSATFADITGKNDTDIDALVSSIWVALAIRCGATASEALACAPGSAPYVIPDFITAPEPNSAARSRCTKAVATLLTRNTAHWYALHMRTGVTFEQLQTDIAADIKPAPTLFYPCRTISRNLRNRKVIAEQPYIDRTVFFRTAPEAVQPMFRKIGDKAWCYRMTATPGSPYAIISAAEMQRFQSAIGQFTPDTEIHPIGEIALRPTDRVILLMADFYNQEGRIDKILTDTDGRTIYRVAFTNSTGIEWTVDADTRQLTTP